MNHLDETGPYIWLRYATQYSKSGQVHTIEMSIPVPLGASPERREELIREAEAGMSQLVSHFGHRLPQILQRDQPSQAEHSTASQSPSVQKSVLPQQPRNRPASVPASQTASLPSGGQVREAPPVPDSARNEEPVVPPTRPNIGASMPMALGSALDSNGNLALPEFIQYINENLNLTPRQAMEMLKVKSLSTGVNLREALERLRYLIAQKNANSTTQFQSRVQSEVEPEHPPGRHEAVTASVPVSTADESQAQQPLQMPDDKTNPERERKQKDQKIIEMRLPDSVRFNEEEDPIEEEEDLEDLHLPREFTPGELEHARSKISELRESQGASVASPKRLQALGNVIGDQISQERLQELISGLWGISTLKKMKVDQVEVLISWAKQDDFIDEVEAALVVLEEDRYARGNR